MYAQEERPKENKSQAIANAVAQKKSSGKQGFGFKDNRPETIQSRQLQEMTKNNNMASHGIVQRVVEVKDDDIGPVVAQIRNEEAYKACERSEKKVSIKKGSITQTTPLTPHNKDKIDAGIDVEITIKQEHLQEGLKVDEPTTINPDGRTHEDILVLEDTGMMPIFDITGRYETIKNQIGMERRAIVPKDLSAATTLLHEVGHAVQYLQTLPDRAHHQQIGQGKQLIDLPVLSDLSKLNDDIQEGKVESKLWPLRVYELSDMGMILNILKDLSVDGVPEVESLRLMVLDRVKIWMEHDVMINVEHPFAASRDEGIRLRHGEELDQRVPTVEEGKEGMDITRTERVDRTVAGKEHLDVHTAGEEMRGRLKQDSADLPQLMAKLVEMYKSLSMPGDLLEEYVGKEFK